MLAQGSVVGGFTIQREIGSGAMGAVYAARHRWLGRPAAIKVIHDDLGCLPSVKERLLREARIVAALHHPNIVKVIDAGTHDGRPWLAMELLQGEPLSERLARERLSPFDAIDYLRQVCSALA